MSELKPPNKRRSVAYYDIDANLADQRIDNFLQRVLKKCPKQLIYRIIRKGEVRVNAKRIKPNYRLCAGDKVRVPPVTVIMTDPGTLSPTQQQQLEAMIVYEDNRLMVINKPSGQAVHSGSGIRQGLIEKIRLLRPALKETDLVHRLDRDTSGCVLVAKRRSMLRHLHAALSEGKVDKRYQVLVHGDWQHDAYIRCDVPLLTDARKGGERHVKVGHPDDLEAKAAMTGFQVIKRYGTVATLLAAYPETGRTHQIRVHCAHLGHPVVGDQRYGDTAKDKPLRASGLNRLFLHAEMVSFMPVDGGKMQSYSCDVDKEWLQCLTKLDDMT